MYEFEDFYDLSSPSTSSLKNTNITGDLGASISESDDSDATIIEPLFNIEDISNKYFRKEDINKETFDAEVETPERSDSKDNLSASDLQSNFESTSTFGVGLTNSVRSVLTCLNNESDLELESIIKKYTNVEKVSIDKSNFVLKKSTSSTVVSSTFDEPIELSSDDDDLPSIKVKNASAQTVRSITSDKNTVDIDNDNFLKENKVCNHNVTDNIAMVSQKNSYKDIFEEDDLDSAPPKKRRMNVAKETKKNERAIQQAKKREEAERAKKLKRAFTEANKNMKPEECIKFITALLDTEIANEKYGGEILNSLNSGAISYKLQSQLVPYTVTWSRKVQEHIINDNEELSENWQTVTTDTVLLILNWSKIIELVNSRSMLQYVESVKAILKDKKLSLAIYGLKNYFKYQKNQKQKEIRSKVTEEVQKHNNKYDKIYKSAPKVSEDQLETALTELQLFCNCCYRLLDTPEDIGEMIAQYSKAIAQAPYKLEKEQKLKNAEWYMSGDNKDCVRVDKYGNGLQRLWQQQLTTFPLTRLEHAEAIAAKYPSPASLIEEYSQCSQEQGEKILKDIPVRRAVGPLTAVRKIGPELSKKIYSFFTSKNGDLVL